MSRLSDLVLDSKLRTELRGSNTVHTYLDIDAAGRRFCREEHWTKEYIIGRGGFSQVRLEKCVTGYQAGDLFRAVKVIYKPSTNNYFPFVRELETIAKFSNDRVRNYFQESRIKAER